MTHMLADVLKSITDDRSAMITNIWNLINDSSTHFKARHMTFQIIGLLVQSCTCLQQTKRFWESCRTANQVLPAIQVPVTIRLGVGLHWFIHHSEHSIDVEGEVEFITKHITKDTTSPTKMTFHKQDDRYVIIPWPKYTQNNHTKSHKDNKWQNCTSIMCLFGGWGLHWEKSQYGSRSGRAEVCSVERREVDYQKRQLLCVWACPSF